MKIYLSGVCFLFTLGCMAQTHKSKNDSIINCHIDPEQASPKYDLESYLRKNLRYPADAKQRKIEGKVIVKFVVREDGKIGSATIVRGLDSECNKEALRVVMHMPPWKPCKQNGKLVKETYILPINFKLK